MSWLRRLAQRRHLQSTVLHLSQQVEQLCAHAKAINRDDSQHCGEDKDQVEDLKVKEEEQLAALNYSDKDDPDRESSAV